MIANIINFLQSSRLVLSKTHVYALIAGTQDRQPRRDKEKRADEL